MQAQTNVQFWILPSHLNHSMDICRRCRTNQDTLVKIKCKKNCQGCFNFRHGKIKQKSTEMLVEITSILTKTLPQSIPKNPPLHTRPCLQHSHEMLWPTPPWLGRCYPITKKNERFPAKIQDFSSQIKGGQSHHRSRKSLKDEILQKACKQVFKTKVANWRISPGASKSWSNFSEVKWQWQSTSAMALRGTQAPPSAKTHVLVDGSSCFGTAKLLFLNTGLVLLSSLWVDFSQYNSQLLGLYLQVSTLQFLLIRLS